MPRYRIVVEEYVTRLLSKVFEAESLTAAKQAADQDCWSEDNEWEEIDFYTNSDIRHDQCEEVDQSAGAHPDFSIQE